MASFLYEIHHFFACPRKIMDDINQMAEEWLIFIGFEVFNFGISVTEKYDPVTKKMPNFGSPDNG